MLIFSHKRKGLHKLYCESKTTLLGGKRYLYMGLFNCGCDNDSSWIWIIILILILFNGNGCGCDNSNSCGCGGILNNDILLIIIVILLLSGDGLGNLLGGSNCGC